MPTEKALRKALDILINSSARGSSTLTPESKGVADTRAVLAQPNIVGAGIGYRIRNGRQTRQLCFMVFVEKKIRDRKQLRGDEIIPRVLPPEATGGQLIETDVYEVGRLRPEGVLQPGSSIGHISGATGTLGTLVTKGRQMFVLSNSHVLARAGKAKIGDRILSPGVDDGGRAPRDVIGRLAGFRKFAKAVKSGQAPKVNTVDCAIATLSAEDGAKVQAALDRFGAPRGEVPPRRGMRVYKRGDGSGKTNGRVIAYPTSLTIPYDGVGLVGFRDVALCTRYTRGGDSGSLVIDRQTNCAVGLHFSGGPAGSAFCPIGNVRQALNVELVLARTRARKRR